MTLPNLLTLSRLLLVPPFAFVLFREHSRAWLVALFVLAALTDWLDGYFARRLGQVTERGAWLDQMVDRAFTVGIVGCLAWHAYLRPPTATDRGFELPTLLALATTRELLALPAVAIAVARGVALYHVEWVGKLATFVQSVCLAAIVLELPIAGALAIVSSGVGVAAASNYSRYAWNAPARGEARERPVTRA